MSASPNPALAAGHAAAGPSAAAASDWFDGFAAADFDVGGTRIHARTGGNPDAPPLLLLHGFPQTHVMWHRVARTLAPHFNLVLPDLRGYGRSAKPADAPDHASYSKRAMAADMVALMHMLGHQTWHLAGHDRGARVAHRMALDAPQAVRRLALLDIAPTLDMYAAIDMRFASAYYHWFFLIQPAPHPERMIGGDPLAYLHWKLGGWGSGNAIDGGSPFEPAALHAYGAGISDPDTVHAMCEDYRASAGIDLVHDRADRAAGHRICCETLVLWAQRGVVHALFDPLALWRAQCAARVQGMALACGHFLPEEQPEATAAQLLRFFAT